MVPGKEGEATNQTEPNANSVSSSHSPGTITLTHEWKHKYLHMLTKARGRGGLGTKSQCKLSNWNNETQIT